MGNPLPASGKHDSTEVDANENRPKPSAFQKYFVRAESTGVVYQPTYRNIRYRSPPQIRLPAITHPMRVRAAR
jgi:hypothetical protein